MRFNPEFCMETLNLMTYTKPEHIFVLYEKTPVQK